MAVVKSALVSFTNSHSVSIVETKTIATDRDRTRLNNGVWDGSAEVQPTWFERGKKKGRIKEHYTAKNK